MDAFAGTYRRCVVLASRAGTARGQTTSATFDGLKARRHRFATTGGRRQLGAGDSLTRC